MSAKIRIMVRATLIRMKRGEKLEDILECYPKLTEAEKDEVRKAVSPDNGNS